MIPPGSAYVNIKKGLVKSRGSFWDTQCGSRSVRPVYGHIAGIEGRKGRVLRYVGAETDDRILFSSGGALCRGMR